MTRAAILARVSDATQADRHSLPFQLDIMHSWAEREGWEVVATYRIPGESAYKDFLEDRPQFAAAIGDALAGRFDVLLVYDLTRFARSQSVLHATLRDLRLAGVSVKVATGEWDATADPMRAGLEGIIAEAHSRQSSEKIRHALNRRFAKGLPIGDIPFGYVRTGLDTPPAVVPEEAEAIRKAFVDYATGKGHQAIAGEWNRLGLRPHSKRGLTAFTTSSVQSVIESRFYAGFVTHRGDERVGAHEAIVTEAQWEAARNRTRRIAHVHTGTALLYGLPVCAECHGPIWSSTSGEYRTNYYFEASIRRGRECPDAGLRWRTDQVDAIVSATVTAMALEDEWAEFAHRQSRKPIDRAAGKRRRDLEDERRRVGRAMQIGAYTEKEAEREIRRIQRELATLPEEEPTVIMAAGERLTGMAEAWDYWTPNERNEACRTLLEEVEIDVREKRLRVKPRPEFMALFTCRAAFVASAKVPGTPDRSGGVTRPSGVWTPAELGVKRVA
jgi:DNA invertase Pin-like site-specific DNA recombinase